jgi:hypothetical protein
VPPDGGWLGEWADVVVVSRAISPWALLAASACPRMVVSMSLRLKPRHSV